MMEYHKLINLLDDTTNQTSKFRTRSWVKINDEPKGRYNKLYLLFDSSSILTQLLVLTLDG